MEKSDDQFNELAQWVLAALFLAALMIRVDMSDDDGTEQAKMSALLILVVVIAFVALFYFVLKEFRKQLKKDTEVLKRFSSNINLPHEQKPKVEDVQVVKHEGEGVTNTAPKLIKQAKLSLDSPRAVSYKRNESKNAPEALATPSNDSSSPWSMGLLNFTNGTTI